MKTCSNCKKEKLKAEFNKKKKNKDGSEGLQPWCRECNRIRSRQYYADNRLNHIELTREKRRKNFEFNLSKLKEVKVSCSLCSENEFFCLDFHHLHDKDAAISLIIRDWSWNRIVEEIQKCVVLCSNCHRKVHAGLLFVDESMLCKI